MAGIDAAERDRADERIVHDLEAEHGERLVIERLADDLLAGVHVDALDALAIGGRRQIGDDGVEQRLHALVLEGRAAENRNERDVPDRLADQPLQGLEARLLAVEKRGQHFVVEFDGGFNQLLAIFLGLVEQLGRDLFVVIFGAEALVFPDDRLHAQQIDDALEIRLRTDRQLDAYRAAADLGLDLVDAAKEVGADLVHLVDEHDARNVVFVGLTPNGLGLRLYALVAVEHAYGAVEHAERALDFDGEVDVAGGVDDVEALVLPEGGRRGGRDGDAALLLLLHPIHGRSAVVHFADLMRFAGIIQDTLGRRRLAGVDMRHDAEVAVVLDRMTAWHGLKFQLEVGQPLYQR